MKATISATEPNILGEAKLDDLFIVRAAGHQECIATLSWATTAMKSGPLQVVFIACRVDEGEPGYQRTGSTFSFPRDTPITFVEQIEPCAFRERTGQTDEQREALRLLEEFNRTNKSLAATVEETLGAIEASPAQKGKLESLCSMLPTPNLATRVASFFSTMSGPIHFSADLNIPTPSADAIDAFWRGFSELVEKSFLRAAQENKQTSPSDGAAL